MSAIWSCSCTTVCIASRPCGTCKDAETDPTGRGECGGGSDEGDDEMEEGEMDVVVADAVQSVAGAAGAREGFDNEDGGTSMPLHVKDGEVNVDSDSNADADDDDDDEVVEEEEEEEEEEKEAEEEAEIEDDRGEEEDDDAHGVAVCVDEGAKGAMR